MNKDKEDIKAIFERLNEFIKSKGLSVRAFEIKVGVSEGVFGKAIRSGTTTGIHNISKIIEAFPELNPKWLLTGKGEIIQNVNLINSTTFQELKDENAKLKKEVTDLKDNLIEVQTILLKQRIRAIKEIIKPTKV